METGGIGTWYFMDWNFNQATKKKNLTSLKHVKRSNI